MEKYSFRQIMNNKGCYANIYYDIEETHDSDSKLEIAYNGDSQWESITKAAAIIFFDYYLRVKKGGRLKVNIFQIDELPGDTNSLIVLYGIVQMLSEKLSINIRGLTLNEEQSQFCFPDVRTI